MFQIIGVLYNYRIVGAQISFQWLQSSVEMDA